MFTGKRINIKSKGQIGGITAGVINNLTFKNNKKGSTLQKMAAVATIIALIPAYGLISAANKEGDDNKMNYESYNVKSENQTGGITAGKIENLTLITDKESLGIREPNDLYRDDKKVGRVIDPNIDESNKTFTIKEIQLDRPIPNGDLSYMSLPFQFDRYIIVINHIDDLISMSPPGAKGISGVILEVQ